MQIYKFRPLTTLTDFTKLLQILITEKFWFSDFTNFNDALEGVFKTINPEIINPIYTEKNKYKICSFSGVNGLNHALNWGHYANGYKGVAIEIKVNTQEQSHQVRYINNLGSR